MFSQLSLKITLATLILASSALPAQAATKRVATDCCELLIPSSMKYTKSGDRLSSTSGDLTLVVDSIEASSAEETAIEILEMLSVKSVTYEQQSSMWAVKTGYLESGDIFYIRAEYDRGCGASGYMLLWYPKSKKKAFYNTVTAMSKSFRSDLC